MTKIKKLVAALAVIGVAAFTAGCGDDDSPDGAASKSGNGTDAAFVTDMIPHHEGAIEMAAVAQKRAEHPELKELADDIISAQKREIETMRSVEQDLGDAHQDGHMSGDEHARGMDSDAHMLGGARPFDRAFIDMMIPHHQGAVTMAKEELAKGENPTLRKLAESIITAQNREIAQMRDWREEWYGAAGGGMHGGY